MATTESTEDYGRDDGKELLPSTSPDGGQRNNSCVRCLKAVFNRLKKWRNLIGFWIIGLCNNFPYVIMLSAAYDIIHKIEGNPDAPSNVTSASSCVRDNYTLLYPDGHNETRYDVFLPRKCHLVSTGAILLADILPTLIIKVVCPWWMDKVPFWIRILICTVASLASFILVAASEVEALIIFGVVCASIGSGFGEIVFLSFTSFFDKSTVSAWSSGTGAAGIGAAMVYLALTSWIGLSPTITLYIQTVVPVVLLLTFLFIIKRPKKVSCCPCMDRASYNVTTNDRSTSGHEEHGSDEGNKNIYTSGDTANRTFKSGTEDDETPLLTDNQTGGAFPVTVRDQVNRLLKELLHRLKLIPPLLWYMIPLFAVYVGEYLINQGLVSG
jgi:battenin